MSTASRTQCRAEQYRRFQGYIFQELATARRWSTYSTCAYSWLCELDDHPYFYATIKYLLRSKGVSVYSLTSSSVSQALSQLDTEEFLRCLSFAGSTGSVQGFLPDVSTSSTSSDSTEELVTVTSVQEVEVSTQSTSSDSSSSESEITFNPKHQPLQVQVSEDPPLCVGLEETPSHPKRSESIQTKLMNQISDNKIPVVVIASNEVKQVLLTRSERVIRDFDGDMQPSPVTISDNSHLIRCGKKKIVVLNVNGTTGDIMHQAHLKHHVFNTYYLHPDNIVRDIDGSDDNFIEHWLKGHHFEINATNDLVPAARRRCVRKSRPPDRAKKRKRCTSAPTLHPPDGEGKDYRQ